MIERSPSFDVKVRHRASYFETITPHTSNVLLYQLFTRLIRLTRVRAKEAFVSSRFCLGACAASDRCIGLV
jgi:hypothetical protein